ncbi:MAG: hypothetical protein U9O55_04615 [Patescibacteria group bacterium]|nr:hypothetical protein [Patescibacteria group bacterium]
MMKIKFVAGNLFLILAFILFPNVLKADSGYADNLIYYVKIYGVVKDSITNEPIPATEISVKPTWYSYNYQPASSNSKYTQTTNENGEYILYFTHNIPKATDVIAKAEGYKECKIINIELTLYDEIQADFVLEKEEKKIDPVILIPGIMGSYLNNADDGKEVWPNLTRMFLSGDDDYLNDLILSETGVPKTNNIAVGNIISKISDNDFFEGLINELVKNDYKKNVNLFVLPYDWRREISYLAGYEAGDNPNTLNNKILKIISKPGFEKVNIISHSMGGLIAKKYMEIFGASNVNKFIDIATPHLGSPKAAKILMYGDDMDIGFLGLGLNQKRAKIISQNMPSVYQLLPSKLYFDENNKNYNSYLADIFDIDNNDILGNLNYDQSIELLVNKGRNNELIKYNDNLHKSIDNYSPKNNGVDTYNITGCGIATIGKIYILNKEKSGGYEYALRYISGDGTVPRKSAEHLETNNEFYIKNIKHAVIPSANGIKQLVATILKDDIDNFKFSDFNNLSEDNSFCSLNGTQISFHSPINLHIYDNLGNHVGPVQNNDIEMNIPGVEYDIIDGNKFAFLPKDKNYIIKGEATDIGTFNARIQKIENNEYTKTAYFNEIALNSVDAKIQLEINNNIEDYEQIKMQVDKDGNDIIDYTINPDSILTKYEIEDFEKPKTEINIVGKKENETSDYYLNSVLIELIGEDNENGSGILKTEYSLDNGEIWKNYKQPITLNIPQLSSDIEIIYTIKYSSTDRAGNREKEKQEIIKIKKLITINSAISNIKELYNIGEIKRKLVKNNLIKKLKQINKNIEKQNKKIKQREKRFEKMSKLCEKRKNKEKCEEKIKIVFNKINDHLSSVHKKIIEHKFKHLLKLLDFYHKKEWITDKGYDIIKMELNYLINNIKIYEPTK